MSDVTYGGPAFTGRPSNSLVFAVGELNGKIDQLLGLVAKVSTLEGRVVKLEVWQGYVKGALAMIVFVIGSMEVLRYVHLIP